MELGAGVCTARRCCRWTEGQNGTRLARLQHCSCPFLAHARADVILVLECTSLGILPGGAELSLPPALPFAAGRCNFNPGMKSPGFVSPDCIIGMVEETLRGTV